MSIILILLLFLTNPSSKSKSPIVSRTVPSYNIGISIGNNFPTWIQVIEKSASTWNEYVKPQLERKLASPLPPGCTKDEKTGDGISVVYYGFPITADGDLRVENLLSPDSVLSLAECFTITNENGIKESDIIINQEFIYPIKNHVFDLQHIMIHEFGHFLAPNTEHNPDSLSVMFFKYRIDGEITANDILNINRAFQDRQ